MTILDDHTGPAAGAPGPAQAIQEEGLEPKAARSLDLGRRRWLALAVLAIATCIAYLPTIIDLLFRSAPGNVPGQNLLAIAIIVVGVGVGFMDARPHRIDIHDPEVDVLTGVALLAAAVTVIWLLPDQMGDLVDVWRPELLSLGLFLAGGLCLAVGLRGACRCWPALIGVALASPIVVQLVFIPLDRALAEAGARLAIELAGLSEGGSTALALSFASGGTFHSIHLEEATAAFGFVPVSAMVLVAIASILRGRAVARFAIVVLGTGIVGALLVLRTIIGTLLAVEVSPDAGQIILGSAGTFSAILLSVVAIWGIAHRLGLRWPRPTGTTGPGGNPKAVTPRTNLTVAALLLSLTALIIVGVDHPGESLQAPFASRASALMPGSSPRLDGLTPVSSTEGPSPYVTRGAGGGTWRRTHYAPLSGTTVPGATQIVLDVADADEPSTMQLYPTRLLYEGFDKSVSHHLDLLPGLESSVTTYFGNEGRPALSTVSWTWTTPDGRAEQVTLLSSLRAPGYGLPTPVVDLSRGLTRSLSTMLRGDVDGSPAPNSSDVATIENAMIDLARAVAIDLQTGRGS